MSYKYAFAYHGNANPKIIYLSSDNVSERLHKARINRNETPPSAKQIQFWEKRKKMDFSIMPKLSVQHDVYDISLENWDFLIEEMSEHDLDLITHPKTATEYAEVKRSLFNNYEHDRDGYTAAKGEFMRGITEIAKGVK